MLHVLGGVSDAWSLLLAVCQMPGVDRTSTRSCHMTLT